MLHLLAQVGAGFGGEASGPRAARVREGVGGETSEALVSLARLGGVDSLLLAPWVVLGAVFGALAMVGSLLVLLEIASTFDVGLPCSSALDVGLLRS